MLWKLPLPNGMFKEQQHANYFYRRLVRTKVLGENLTVSLYILSFALVSGELVETCAYFHELMN